MVIFQFAPCKRVPECSQFDAKTQKEGHDATTCITQAWPLPNSVTTMNRLSGSSQKAEFPKKPFINFIIFIIFIFQIISDISVISHI